MFDHCHDSSIKTARTKGEFCFRLLSFCAVESFLVPVTGELEGHQQVALCVNLRNENRYLRKLRKEIMVIA